MKKAAINLLATSVSAFAAYGLFIEPGAGNSNTENKQVDPTNCEDVACSSKKSMFMKGLKVPKPRKNDNTVTNYEDCPLDREELGRSTWEYLHSTAAYYPENPTEEQKLAARGMIQAIAKLYPCLYCRQHFAEETLEDPPDVSSRAALSVWLCKRHNTVNKWLGKTEFPCTPEALDRRWRKGGPHCKPELSSKSESAEESLGQ